MKIGGMPKTVAERMRARMFEAVEAAVDSPNVRAGLYEALALAGVRAGLEWALLTASNDKEGLRIAQFLTELDDVAFRLKAEPKP